MSNQSSVCSVCSADFTVEGYNIDEPVSYCPYCGSFIDPEHDQEFDEEFYDEDRLDD